ncbi:toxin-activating lysine-acyltransferase [Rhizobium paknamense]|uniref:RTX toxin-activating lysine-acyltransferase n=1 Tax=Rhizobium paknamense TaxID=1206817 RepID=A0ABU0IEN2_9HYPH|nr:toxin-activating lysine-acyltransferase [Rhizobium paknamense]MDQ0456700.1 hemolysin-activating ACP:hemolysin acyltransferase [Rhizobium paknamense]
MSDTHADAVAEGKISAEALEKILGLKNAIHLSFGTIVLAMSSVPRYRHQSLADLAHLVIDPLARDCVAIASPKPSDDADPKAALAPAAIAIWATVSDEVEAKIREQIKAGVFPVRLKPADWRSGDKVWLLDVIAPSRELATMVLKSFNHVAKTDQVSIHPIVAQLVDREVLRQLVTASPSNADIDQSKTIN